MPDRHRAVRLLGAVLLLGLLVSCSGSPSPSAPGTSSAAPTATPNAAPTASAVPTATPEPELSLPLPDQVDERRVAVSIDPQVATDGGGRIVVSVTNLSETRITELVLRWDTDLGATLFLAPFEPAEARIVDGGPPLIQPWTKWVLGPGERGEPAGTTSLGWGPLDAGVTLTIPIVVTRRAEGAVSFDLQVLADEAILTLDGGGPAELRVSVP
jgi:hypothetical protein